ncbi:class A beta-lactamase [Undibacter mobilis]|uniref:beta-lactamase n=1 Tax=Undibacter mobilis TaxID=2292256 RepID=A0A371B0H6_9BRAD|nr:class A beta-lactamase [Undibacter mobilis]RDV01075.1 class A beta-lactamase [Undibacter mobilis]
MSGCLSPLSRRQAVVGLASLPLLSLPNRAYALDPPAQRVAALEKKIGGRVGVYLRDITGRVLVAHRADERFPMCSTFKFLLAAAALRRVDQGQMSLDQVLNFGEADLLSYAPVAKANVAKGGLSLGELCAAIVTVSDNTAANVILRNIGGPQAVTAFARAIGDPDTRLDRTEPELNSAIPGDPRDTTTPQAITEDLFRLLSGNVLAPASQQMLENWMIASKTGLKRLRAGVPNGWSVGDKTGTGANGSANVVAIIRPGNRATLFASVYLTGSTAEADELDAVHAEIGRIAADIVTKS